MGTGKSPFVWASGCGQEIVKVLPVLLSRTPASVFRLVLLEPEGGGWVGFRSEGKLYCDQRCELRLSQWQAAAGLLCGVPAAGGAQHLRTRARWRLGWRVLRSVRMWPWGEVLRQAFCTGNSSLKGWVWDLCTQDPVSQWNETKHKGRGGKN